MDEIGEKISQNAAYSRAYENQQGVLQKSSFNNSHGYPPSRE